MELSDQKYSELKKDRQISEAIAMIKSIMVDNKAGRVKKEQEYYTVYADYLSKSINTLENLINDSTAMDLLKIDEYLQFYLNELRKSKYPKPEVVNVLEKLKNDSFLTSVLDFNIGHYLRYQINQLKESKKSLLKSRPRRIGKFTSMNIWLEEIILRLKLLEIKNQSLIVDFIFRLYKELNIKDLEYDDDDKDLEDDDDDLEYKHEYLYGIKKYKLKKNIRKIVKSVFTD